MTSRWLASVCATATVMVLSIAYALHAEPPDAAATPAKEAAASKIKRMPVAEARERARLMHNIYASTLETMHHYYFHQNKSMVPARAMEDIFEELVEETGIQARWISINTKAMSVDHAPASDFEKKAVVEISSGKEMHENIDKGYYERAGVIPLSAGCVGCHTGFFGKPSKNPKFAGLVIRIPVTDK